MTENRLATFTGDGKYRRVEVRRVINAPIDKVWRAIVNADEVRRWWAAGEIGAREGGRIRLGLGDCGGGDDELPLDGRIKIFQPPHVLEFTWNEGYVPAMGLVRFDLIALDGNRTQVTIINLVPSKDIIPAAAGWHEIVDHLGNWLEGGQPHDAADDARFRELCALYESAADSAP